MATDKTYNGWSNYETWACNLWMDNEKGSQDHWREVTAECLDSVTEDKLGTFTKAEQAAFQFAALLKDNIENDTPDLGCTFYSDMLSAAMQEVNYYEIAKSWIDNVIEDRS